MILKTDRKTMEAKKLQSFKDLNVWKKSSDLAVLIYKLTDKFPKPELYGLTNQMRRAVISISSNLAEGFKRCHKKEKLQFYNVAYGSVAEIESQIEISKKLNFISEEDYQKIILNVIEVGKMIDGLIKSVHQNFISSCKSKLLVFLFFLYSISYILYPSSVIASTLYFLPQSQDVYLGDTFIVEARIDTEQREINAIEGLIAFPKDKLTIADIGIGDSAVNLWVKDPVYSNDKGEISFSGGMPNGFKGQGVVLKITFKAIGGILDQNAAKVYFAKNSKILLNDGKGTPDGVFFLDGDYKVMEKELGLPIISSPSLPDQEKWYKGDSVQLHWNLIKDAEYSYILTKDALAEPDDTPDRPGGDLQWMGDMTLKGFKDDGIYYFRLKQKLPGKDWSNKVTFRIMLDNIPPEEFAPKIAEIEGKKYLVFSAQDKTSGVDYYQVKEEKEDGFFAKLTRKEKAIYKIAAIPYLLEDQNSASIIKIKAVDKAGNERVAEIIPASKKFSYGMIVLILAAFAILLWFIFKRLVKFKHGKGQ